MRFSQYYQYQLLDAIRMLGHSSRIVDSHHLRQTLNLLSSEGSVVSKDTPSCGQLIHGGIQFKLNGIPECLYIVLLSVLLS